MTRRQVARERAVYGKDHGAGTAWELEHSAGYAPDAPQHQPCRQDHFFRRFHHDLLPGIAVQLVDTKHCGANPATTNARCINLELITAGVNTNASMRAHTPHLDGDVVEGTRRTGDNKNRSSTVRGFAASKAAFAVSTGTCNHHSRPQA
jgi:hypothetical protein